MLGTVLVLATVAVGLYALDRLGLWAEERGWIYYRRKHASPGSVGNAVAQVHSLLEPDKRYVYEVRVEERDEEDGEGEGKKRRSKGKGKEQVRS